MQNTNQNNVRLEIIRASEIEPREIEWPWYPFIPSGTGKSIVPGFHLGGHLRGADYRHAHLLRKRKQKIPHALAVEHRGEPGVLTGQGSLIDITGKKGYNTLT